MRPIMINIIVTMANDSKAINFDVVAWVNIIEDFSFIPLHKVKGDVRRGRYRSIFIFGLWRLGVFIFAINMPCCICSFLLFPVCNDFLIVGSNVIGRV